MTIEQTLRGDRITIKEAVNMIVENLRLSETTARKKTIYEPDFAQALKFTTNRDFNRFLMQI